MNCFQRSGRFLLLTLSLFFYFTGSAQQAVNLALKKNVYASSGRGLPLYAVDGLANTRWESEFNDPQWICVDLGASYPINRVKILWEIALGQDYSVQVSENMSSWITIKSVTANKVTTNDLTNLQGRGRYVRVLGTTRGNATSNITYGYSIFELEVYSLPDLPYVTILTPANNTTYPVGSNVTTTAVATVNGGKTIGKVEFFMDGKLVAVDYSTPYSFVWYNIKEGNYLVTAKAYDNSGAVQTSNPIGIDASVITSNQCDAPAFDITKDYSAAGSMVTWLSRQYVNRFATKGQNPAANPNAWKLLSVCNLGATTSIVTTPGPGTYHLPAVIELQAEVIPSFGDRIRNVDFYFSHYKIGTDSTFPYSFTYYDAPQNFSGPINFDTEAPLIALAYDKNGTQIPSSSQTNYLYFKLSGNGCGAPDWRAETNYSTAGAQVTYENKLYRNSWPTMGQNPAENAGDQKVWKLLSACATPPVLTIRSPLPKSRFNIGETVKIDLDATSGNSISKVELYVDNYFVTTLTAAPYQFDLKGLYPGKHAIFVKAFSNTNEIKTSSPVEITVAPAASTYSWTGAGGTNDWNTQSNWLPFGIPGSQDTVNITSGTNFPLLTASTTVANLNMISDSLDLNGQQLLVTGVSRFQGGIISNGSLIVSCDDVIFDGTTFSSNVNLLVNADNVLLNGSVFNGTTVINKNAAGNNDNNSRGGNIFNGPLTITNNSSAGIRLGAQLADDYNGAVTFVNNGAGAFEVAHNTPSTFSGNITTDGFSPISFGAGADGSVIIDGNSSVSIAKLSGAEIVFSKWIINKTAGSVTLTTPVSVSEKLTLQNGLIVNFSESMLTIRAGATTEGGSLRSMISGPVKKIGSGAFTFPLGTNKYRPVSIAPAGSETDAFVAQYFIDSRYNRTTKEATISTVSTCEYWTLDRVAGTTPTTVTLAFDSAGCHPETLSKMIVTRWDGTKWTNHGNGGITGNLRKGSIVTAAEVTSFSPFTLGTSLIDALPVKLKDFYALNRRQDVLLNWSTENESQNAGFQVYRSADGKEFQDIGFVKGSGNSNVKNTYAFSDLNPLKGISYYRLKQIDIPGETTYSKTLFVNRSSSEAKIRLLGNPVSTTATILVNGVDIEGSTITVTDRSGRPVLQKNAGRLTSGKIDLDLTGKSAGVYLITIRSTDKLLFSQRVVKQN